ncbi:MAG: hypothetical protein A2626_00700 [Candidatus Nealsonbacteria bacterium RIFCSPHIGHO2_01_FULL_38_55]|uniref:Glycosyltransferase 2-like domain-containing protein n=2 Tax=Candidatus Nealsoniibacteriota TaxID=1817911 RepID=A0A1G2EI34_9BACT|nr:MAG: hypothetical protein US88_C0003G0020 [Parcubacteria group bacterium GW2011_GWA2_38_27]KKQ98471.1 MAG: hypothetical protein UT22_C0002G0006 [Parcubacteria group bacterium GW2011_GWC2_39_11]OGZ19941.1 MAG: hypothetical protein A2626_00700 [Candidatus Nealsonbacteria bacterium RIFCSPHIGHO2_01_FULL_38_55]OGZ20570.1 MAG: hypothetical protein A2W55_02095 [Candidatus Nealsonbacteria bacterium RIFCSPHIGHO2_02_38_10]OGZ22004.1 MAG: hypothetical protein A3C48_03270 [Candidatus Nealsonbacteria bac
MINENPIISLFGPAVHPEFWMRFYNSLSSNEIPFEVIFVGNKPPSFQLPGNCHFIYTEVKPVQCVEIGARYAVGDLIMPFADDIVLSEHALDNLYREFKELNDDRIILSCRYVWEGKDMTGTGRYWSDNQNSPIMPVGGLMNRKLWQQLGGIDKHFVGLFWDLDIAMRVYEIGGRVVLSKNVYLEEFRTPNIFSKNPLIVKKFLRMFPGIRKKIIEWIVFPLEKKKTLFLEFGVFTDRPTLERFWVMKNEPPGGVSPNSIYCIDKREDRGILSKKRLALVEPFEDKHILTVSQGPKGRWK